MVTCGCSLSLDPVLLWLWLRSVAAALARPLAWEPPYAAGVALKKTTPPYLNLLFQCWQVKQ